MGNKCFKGAFDCVSQQESIGTPLPTVVRRRRRGRCKHYCRVLLLRLASTKPHDPALNIVGARPSHLAGVEDQSTAAGNDKQEEQHHHHHHEELQQQPRGLDNDHTLQKTSRSSTPKACADNSGSLPPLRADAGGSQTALVDPFPSSAEWGTWGSTGTGPTHPSGAPTPSPQPTAEDSAPLPPSSSSGGSGEPICVDGGRQAAVAVASELDGSAERATGAPLPPPVYFGLKEAQDSGSWSEQQRGINEAGLAAAGRASAAPRQQQAASVNAETPSSEQRHQLQRTRQALVTPPLINAPAAGEPLASPLRAALPAIRNSTSSLRRPLSHPEGGVIRRSSSSVAPRQAADGPVGALQAGLLQPATGRRTSNPDAETTSSRAAQPLSLGGGSLGGSSSSIWTSQLGGLQRSADVTAQEPSSAAAAAGARSRHQSTGGGGANTSTIRGLLQTGRLPSSVQQLHEQTVARVQAAQQFQQQLQQQQQRPGSIDRCNPFASPSPSADDATNPFMVASPEAHNPFLSPSPSGDCRNPFVSPSPDQLPQTAFMAPCSTSAAVAQYHQQQQRLQGARSGDLSTQASGLSVTGESSRSLAAMPSAAWVNPKGSMTNAADVANLVARIRSERSSGGGARATRSSAPRSAPKTPADSTPCLAAPPATATAAASIPAAARGISVNGGVVSFTAWMPPAIGSNATSDDRLSSEGGGCKSTVQCQLDAQDIQAFGAGLAAVESSIAARLARFGAQ